MADDPQEIPESQYLTAEAQSLARRNDEVTPLLGEVRHAEDSRSSWRDPSLLWLLPPFFFTAIMSGASITPRLSLISNLLCHSYYASKSLVNRPDLNAFQMDDTIQCNIPAISAQIARMSTILNTITGVLAAVTAAKYGVLSDRYGRRYPLMLAMVGALANDACYILVGKYYESLSIYFLFIGAICDGLAGSYMSSLAATYAYATDIVPSERRAVAFGYFQCCFYGGIALGPTLGGYVVQRTQNVLIIFYLAFTIHVVFSLYTLLILPESLSQERRTIAITKHAQAATERENSASARGERITTLDRFSEFFNIFKVLSVFRPSNTHPIIKRNLVLLMSIDICLLLNMGIFTVVILYGKLMFNWGDLEQGYLLSVIGGVRVLVLLAVLPIVVRIFRRSRGMKRATDGGDTATKADGVPDGADTLDIWLIRASMLLEIAGFLSFAAATSPATYYAAGAMSAIAGIGLPTLASTLTKHVSPSQTGQLLGAVALMQSLNRVASPLIFGFLYSWTVTTHPAASFVLMALLMFFGLVLSIGLRRSDNLFSSGHGRV